MSFFRYPGGKSKLKSKILDRLTGHNLQYREPFFGGGSIGLELHTDKMWINDKDVGISCLWTSVIRYPEDFKRQVLNFIPTVQSFQEIKSELHHIKMPIEKKDIVDIGFKKLAIHQISYSGLGTKSGGPLGGVEQKSKYKIDCRWSPQYICKKIDKLHDKLKSIQIYENSCTNLDFIDLINNSSCDSILYLDPPYYVKGNDLYQHGFMVKDHVRLCEALKATKHKWVLSYDDCPQIRKLYEWAKVETLSVNYTITALKDEKTGDRISRAKTELLIYDY